MRLPLLGSVLLSLAALSAPAADLRIGLVGLDTSHAVVNAKFFNDPQNPLRIPGARIVVAYAGGSPDIPHSWSLVQGYTRTVRDTYGVKIVPTIEEVVAQSDAIMILSVDGRTHLAQARAVFPSGKPVFIDKPLGGSLRDALEIAHLAEIGHVPLYSGSSLRFSPGVQKLVQQLPKIGKIRGAISVGPSELEAHHPDLYWYGIHPTEALYTIMGAGCESVSRTHTADTDVAVGTWAGGRTGVLYGLRNGKSEYHLTVLGAKAIIDGDDEQDYRLTTVRTLEFFRTGISPVPLKETLEIMAFMEAADESKRRGGAAVTLKEVLEKNAPPE